jgi:hypothetical protein
MEEEVKQDSVSSEVAPQETENRVEAEPKPQVDDRQDRNWKELRRAKDELERKSKMQDEMIATLIANQSRQQPVQKNEPDELDSIGSDEFIPKGKVDMLIEKKAARIAQEIAQKEAEKIIKQRDQAQYKDHLLRKYPDFDEIVNPETIALLEEQDPELANTIAEIKDPYKIGVQAYKYIKAMKIVEKAPEARRSRETEKKIEENSKTVQTPLAYDKRPMAQAFNYADINSDKKLQSELFKEMNKYAGMAGFSY